MSNWFHLLLGFHEEGCTATAVRKQLEVDNGKLRSKANGAEYSIGEFSTPSLGELRDHCKRKLQDFRAVQAAGLRGAPTVEHAFGNAAELHRRAENRLSLFQVASQLNCLAFTSPTSSPEMGITGYMDDRTQGPCCAIACGAGTVYRNYFVPINGEHAASWDPPVQVGQSRDRQLNCIKELSDELGNETGRYFAVNGGFAVAEDEGLEALNAKLNRFKEEERDDLRSRLRIGVQEDVEVTSACWGNELLKDPEQIVTQVFNSACSLSCPGTEQDLWEPLARLTLEASYEATLWVAVLSAFRHKGACGSLQVYLAAVDNGKRGSRTAWIADAIDRAIKCVCLEYGLALQVFLVSHKEPAKPELNKLTMACEAGAYNPMRRTSTNRSETSASEENARNVSKDTYYKWEQKVIKTFFHRAQSEGKFTEVWPSDGAPTVVVRDALGVCAYEQMGGDGGTGTIPSMVAAGQRAGLPAKRKIAVWNSGRQATDCVCYGFDGKVFRYPICDASGCATVVQKLNSAVDFEGEEVFTMTQGSDMLSLSSEMCSRWRELACRRLPGSLEGDLARWLHTLSQELQGQIELRFCRMPAERRVLVTAGDVQKRLGAYYVKDSGSGARQLSDAGGLICAVSDKSAIPNYDLEVLDLECRAPAPGMKLQDKADIIGWTDICRAAVNDKRVLSKVTGGDAYRVGAITKAVRNKVGRRSGSKQSPEGFETTEYSCASIRTSILVEPPDGKRRSPPTSPPLGARVEPLDSTGTPPGTRRPTLDRVASYGPRPSFNTPPRTGDLLSRQTSWPLLAWPGRTPDAPFLEVLSPEIKLLEPKGDDESPLPWARPPPSSNHSSECKRMDSMIPDKTGLPEREQHQFLDVCKNGDFERVKQFLMVNKAYINVHPGGRWSALHEFAHAGNHEAVKHLLEEKADPDAKSKDGKRPVEVAHKSVVALLREHGQGTKPSMTLLQLVGSVCAPCAKQTHSRQLSR